MAFIGPRDALASSNIPILLEFKLVTFEGNIQGYFRKFVGNGIEDQFILGVDI